MPDEIAAAQERSSLETFAGLLITREAQFRQGGGSEKPEAFHVCEKLRAPLATLMGSTGYHALLSRALTTARREPAWLRTVQVEDTFTALPFSHYTISFLTDDIIRMRYVEIEGQLRKVMVVVKMGGGNQSKDIREYVITDKGVVIISPRQTDYTGLTTGLTTGLPQRIGTREETPPEPKARQ